jgi:hypothetical protein
MFRTSSTLVTGVSSELLSTRFSANLTRNQTARCGVRRAYYEISFTSVFNRGNRLFRCTDAAGSGGCLQPQYHSGHSDGPWRTGYRFSSGQVLHLCHHEERNTCLCQQRMPQGAILSYAASLKKVTSPVVVPHDPNAPTEAKDMLVPKTQDEVYEVNVQERTGPACEDRAQLLARENEVVVALKSGGTTLYAPTKTIVALPAAAAP